MARKQGHEGGEATRGARRGGCPCPGLAGAGTGQTKRERRHEIYRDRVHGALQFGRMGSLTHHLTRRLKLPSAVPLRRQSHATEPDILLRDGEREPLPTLSPLMAERGVDHGRRATIPPPSPCRPPARRRIAASQRVTIEARQDDDNANENLFAQSSFRSSEHLSRRSTKASLLNSSRGLSDSATNVGIFSLSRLEQGKRTSCSGDRMFEWLAGASCGGLARVFGKRRKIGSPGRPSKAWTPKPISNQHLGT